MSFRSTKDFKAFCERRSMRMSERGRKMEEEVELLLEKMRSSGLITWFERHRPNSTPDMNGKDFTVKIVMHEKVTIRSFGITISHQSYLKDRVQYPHIPQFHWPIGTKPETMQNRILGLFQTQQ